MFSYITTLNTDLFFEEMAIASNKAMRKYEKFIIMGDFNIDINNSGSDKNKLKSFWNVLNLRTLSRSKTLKLLYEKPQSTIDLILTITPLSF